MQNSSHFSPTSVLSAITAAGLTAFLSEPVYVNGPAVLRAWLTGRIHLQSAAPEKQQPGCLRNDLQLLDAGGTFLAIQPVSGIVYSGASPVEEEERWMFNLDRVHHTVARVAADPSIGALLFRMDTPGGSVMGLHAAAQAITSLSQRRPGLPVASYIQHDCCSAGMYLAAATQSIHAAPGARVGSIGTIASLTDSSGFWQKLGFDTKFYTADSQLKDMGRGKITPAHDAYMKEQVDRYSAEFKTWMSSRRGLQAADMHGQAWEARMAPAGMVDSAVCATFEEFLAAGLL